MIVVDPQYMGSPCEYSAHCTNFNISLNASCHFITPDGDGEYRALVTGAVDYTLEAVNTEEECGRAFVYSTSNSTVCGTMVDGYCVISADTGSFVSLPRGGIVASKRFPTGPRFTFSEFPTYTQQRLLIVVEPSDPCLAFPDELIALEHDVTFYASGLDGMYFADGPFTLPFLLTEPLYCAGNGWTTHEVCTDRLDVYMPSGGHSISATTTIVPSFVASEVTLLFVWVLIRMFF